MEPCDENQQKINKTVKKLKKNGQTLKEFAEIDSKATKIHKDQKTQTKYRQKLTNIDRNPTQNIQNSFKLNSQWTKIDKKP